MLKSRVLSAMAMLSLTGAVCSAQTVVSAHSGTLHYFEGDVAIDGAPIQSKVGKFADVKEQGVLSTKQGRAEVLLTPGVFLRIGENSSIRMLDNRLASTRVDLLSGSAVVESDDPQTGVKDPAVTLLYKDYEIQMVKHGLVEISTDPAQMKVYKGEAAVTTTGSASPNQRVTVREGRMLPFSAALVTDKFDEKVGDDLLLWARDRSQSISVANMSSARTLNSMTSGGYGYGLGASGYGYGMGSGYGGYYGGPWNGGWYFNPYFNMFTYVPGSGVLWNAFGYGFFSPGVIYNYYTPGTTWYGGGGSRGSLLAPRQVAGLATSTNRPARLGALQSATAPPGAVGRASSPGFASPSSAGGFSGGARSGGGFAARGGGGGLSAGGHAGGGGGHR